MSTSAVEAKAKVFEEGALVQITVPKGAQAIYMDDLDGEHGHEAELLLARSSKFKLSHKEKVGNVWHIELEMIV